MSSVSSPQEGSVPYVGAIDQGTTSTRFAIVDEGGRIVAMDQREHRQIYPQPGWVEHDPAELVERTSEVVAGALGRAGITAADLVAVGITNQRETTIAWDRSSGTALGPAIVWQDTRTDRLVADLAGTAGPDRFRGVTGLPLATYFSGPKMTWMLDEVAGLRKRADAGDAVFGTVDSWLLWNLTGEHLTDPTNASRTMLMSLDTLDWDDSLCEAFGVPRAVLPAIRPSVSVFGEGSGILAGVPIAGVLGDQQAALFGQTCFAPGDAKNTYGTGCFLLLNTGERPVPSTHGLLSTVAYSIEGRPAVYALEGSVAIAGAAVQWLRDGLGLIPEAGGIEALAASVIDNGGVYFVPAFNGLFAPYWRSDARGVITGLTRYATAGHVARATLEATAYQTADILGAMEADSGVALATLFVDGGMVANELLMQFQADVLGVPVARPVVAETTALGAAFAAGLAVGFFSGLDEVGSLWAEDRRWVPRMGEEERRRLLASWHRSVERAF
ncbi:MAG: glycerol kinase [Actinobacteria bacterium RBG_16_68_21]|nr:MAG: glycerol kinase [Actinobacteria bacterium RBG_16_68_21]